MIFVYVKGIRGPVGEKWPDLLVDMTGKVKPALVRYDLSPEDAHQTIRYLEMKYPPPAMPKVVKVKLEEGAAHIIDVRPA